MKILKKKPKPTDTPTPKTIYFIFSYFIYLLFNYSSTKFMGSIYPTQGFRGNSEMGCQFYSPEGELLSQNTGKE